MSIGFVSSDPLDNLTNTFERPIFINADRAPTTNDIQNPGTQWKYLTTIYETTGAGVWNATSGAGVLTSLTGDTGTATPSSGNILIAGGTNLTSAASGSTVTMNLDAVITGLTSLAATTITTNVAAAQLSLNGTTITATGSDSNVSLNLSTKGSGSVVFSRSAAGVDINEQITNSDNTSGTSNAGLQLATGGASGGDPYLQFAISGVGASTMTMGLDNSASDTFVISNSTALGTSNALTLTQAGALSATTTITAGTGIVATTGNISASAGSITAATTLTATSGAITATNGSFTAVAAGTGLVLPVTTGSGAASGTVNCNGRVGSVTFTSVSIAANADLTLTMGNTSVAGASTRLVYARTGTTTGAALSVKSMTPSANQVAWVVTNGVGATTSTADITFDFIVLN